MIAVWMQAADDGGAGRPLEAVPQRADGDGALGREAGVGADAPDVGPPRAEGPEPVEGHLGAGRRAERFLRSARRQAASGVERSSRCVSRVLRCSTSEASSELAAGSVAMCSAARSGGRRFCQ